MNDASDIADRKADWKAALLLAAIFIVAVFATSVHAVQPTPTPTPTPSPTPAPSTLTDYVVSTNPNFAIQVASLYSKSLLPAAVVHGTEYVIGDTASPFLQLSYPNGSVENNAACFIDVYSPAGGKPFIFNNTPMVPRGANGLYYYEFTTSIIGNHMLDAYCSLTSQPRPHSDSYSLITGSLASGSIGDVADLDDSYAGFSPSSKVINLQDNLTPTSSLVNISGFNLYGRFTFGPSGSSGADVSLCLWDYGTKKYGRCTTETIGANPVIVSLFVSSNSTGSNYLNSTGTSGTWSIQANGSNIAAGQTLYVDWLDSQVLAGGNVTADIRGGGEVHVRGNDTQNILGSNNATISTIQASLIAMNNSLHTALSNNYTNTTALTYAWIAEANRTLHGALSLNYSALNSTLSIVIGHVDNANATSISNQNTNTASIIGHVDNANTTLLAAIAALNLSLDGRLTVINNNVLATNVSIIMFINDTNQSLVFYLSNIDNHVLQVNATASQINATANQINSTTAQDLAEDKKQTGLLNELKAKLDNLNALIQDTWLKVTGLFRRSGRNVIDTLLNR